MERAEILDGLCDLGQKVTALLPPGKVKDALSGTAAGHPLHPAMVAVPIGTLGAATAFDLLGDEQAARRLTTWGLVASIPTAAAGLSDWNDTQGPERRVGAAHAVTNILALGLFVASLTTSRPLARRALRLSGASVLSVGGWLGGHLAYALGVGVDTTAFRRPPTEWTDACGTEQLAGGSPIAARVADVHVLLVRHGDTICAIDNRCTHRGGPLNEGTVDGTCIQCPWHASIFDLRDGAVIRGPATRPQPAYDVRVAGDRVQVRRQETRTLRLNPTS